jgi:hypothetical protein
VIEAMELGVPVAAGDCPVKRGGGRGELGLEAEDASRQLVEAAEVARRNSSPPRTLLGDTGAIALRRAIEMPRRAAAQSRTAP